MARKLIGQSMVEARLITESQLNDLLAYQKRSHDKIILGKLSLDLGVVEEAEFAPFIASYFDVPYVKLDEYTFVQKEALEKIPESIAKRFNVMPLTKKDNALTVAVFDPMDLVTIENLETVTGCSIIPVVSTPSHIKHKITMSYGII